MERGSGFVLKAPANAWGLAHVVEHIRAAAASVAEAFPGSVPVVVGDLSSENGGYLPKHRSHKTGRDVDVGFYYQRNRRMSHLSLANPQELDLAKTWHMLRTMIETGGVEMVFLDWELQQPLYEYARDEDGLSPAELERLFQYPRPKWDRAGVIRHLRNHRDHAHVRFFPTAVQTPHMLVKRRQAEPEAELSSRDARRGVESLPTVAAAAAPRLSEAEAASAPRAPIALSIAGETVVVASARRPLRAMAALPAPPREDPDSIVSRGIAYDERRERRDPVPAPKKSLAEILK
jgi:hypothetical protein